jgi:hypothetical protein
MTIVHVEHSQQSGEVVFLLRSAVEGEIAKVDRTP